jgi:DNA-binding winged helix-turn-helix (wHTH) protein/Flp pilus assembly protein TadD
MHSISRAQLGDAKFWCAGDLWIDLSLRRVERLGERVSLPEISLDILLYLWERGGQPVTRKELHERFWASHERDSFERSLSNAMRKLRQAIDDDAYSSRLIETTHANGYRWVGPYPQSVNSKRGHASFEIIENEESLPSLPAIMLARSSRWATLAVMAIALVVALLAWQSRSRTAVTITLPVADSASHTLRDLLLDRLSHLPDLAQVRVENVDRNDPFPVATIEDGSQTHSIPLQNNPEAAEELLVRAAMGTPRHDVHTATLPVQAQHELLEASGLLASTQLDHEAAWRSMKQLTRVTAQTPGYSSAWLALARAHTVLAGQQAGREEQRQCARIALRRAIDTDPRSLLAILALANHLYWHQWDATAADRWFAIARTVAPGDHRVLHAVAWKELSHGNRVEALAQMTAAATANPLDSELQSDWGWFYYRTGDFEGAVRQCRRAASLAQPDPSASECVLRSLAMLHRFDEAWSLLSATPASWLKPDAKARLSRLPPQRAYGEAMRLAADWWRTQPSGHSTAATDYAIAGDLTRAKAELLASMHEREAVAHLIGTTPELMVLRDDPELAPLFAPPHGS